jgi:hypothetical protein
MLRRASSGGLAPLPVEGGEPEMLDFRLFKSSGLNRRIPGRGFRSMLGKTSII